MRSLVLLAVLLSGAAGAAQPSASTKSTPEKRKVFSPEMLARLYDEDPEAFKAQFDGQRVTVYGELHSTVFTTRGEQIQNLSVTAKLKRPWSGTRAIGCVVAGATEANPVRDWELRSAVSGVVNSQRGPQPIMLEDCQRLGAEETEQARAKLGLPPPRAATAVGVRFEDGSLATLWADEVGGLVHLGPGIVVKSQEGWWLFDSVSPRPGWSEVVALPPAARAPKARCPVTRAPAAPAEQETRLTFADERIFSVERTSRLKPGATRLTQYATYRLGEQTPVALDALYSPEGLKKILEQRRAQLDASGEARAHRKEGEMTEWILARVNGAWRARLLLPPVDPEGSWGPGEAVVDPVLNPEDHTAEMRPWDEGTWKSTAKDAKLADAVEGIAAYVRLFKLKDGTLHAYYPLNLGRDRPVGKTLQLPAFTFVSVEDFSEPYSGVIPVREELQQVLASNPCRSSTPPAPAKPRKRDSVSGK